MKLEIPIPFCFGTAEYSSSADFFFQEKRNLILIQ